MGLGPLMLDLEGLSLSNEEQKLIGRSQVGGVILFSRNYQDKAQLYDLVLSIRAVRPDLLIAVDHEGGRVQRFRQDFLAMPPAADIGRLYDVDSSAGIELAHLCGWLIAAELLALEIDLCFAPVLDLELGNSEVIGDRAFHGEPQVVAILGQAFIRGLNEAGMAAVGKHFPGHGGVEADSHVDIPVDKRGQEEIFNWDLLPFSKLAANLGGVMPAHIIYQKIDPHPAGFSDYWLQQVLRKELNFKGLIFSDDLTMEGASVAGDITNRARQALAAGCDMVLVCNDRPAAVKVLDYLRENPATIDSQRLLRISSRSKVDSATLLQSSKWENSVKIMNTMLDQLRGSQ